MKRSRLVLERQAKQYTTKKKIPFVALLHFMALYIVGLARVNEGFQYDDTDDGSTHDRVC